MLLFAPVGGSKKGRAVVRLGEQLEGKPQPPENPLGPVDACWFIGPTVPHTYGTTPLKAHEAKTSLASS